MLESLKNISGIVNLFCGIMARRLGRRKEPKREDYMLKEQTKVDTGIFDEKTMVSLSKFFNLGIISKLGHPIARGKEADLYVAEPGTSDRVKGIDKIAMKFFRVETSSFFKMEDYIIGDRRFTHKLKAGKSKLGIIIEWCRKEYINLELAAKVGVDAPKPIMFNNSILAMSFIGADSKPAPQLRNFELDDPEKVLDKILKDVRSLYRVGLVHADLSEYNILIHEGRPYLIDFGQAVVIDHPNAQKFLERDVRNILGYFSKRYGITKDHAETMRRIRG